MTDTLEQRFAAAGLDWIVPAWDAPPRAMIERSNGPDSDSDGVPSTSDNCLGLLIPGQADVDRDFVGDACDCSDASMA